MPLNADEFNKVGLNRNKTKFGPNQKKIIGLLRDGLGKAYTQGEIEFETGISYSAAVNTALHSLKIKGLITCMKLNGLMYWSGTNGLLKVDISDKESTDEEEADE